MEVVDHNQFGSAKPGSPSNPQQCAQCEAMLADALDGTLSAQDQAFFDLHIAGCPPCASAFADAQRGAAWLDMLRSPQPEPPADLMQRILAQTSGQLADLQTSSLIPSSPAYIRNPNTLLGQPMLVTSAAQTSFPSNVLPFRSRMSSGLRSFGQTMLQPRLAMTAAMAFFSIALTLNLTGVHINKLRASDLKPSSIMRACYETKARVVRYSDNLRVVYELESRVRDLQHSSNEDTFPTNSTPSDEQEPSTSPAPQSPSGDQPNQNQKNPHPHRNPGSSQRQSPHGNMLQAQYARQSDLHHLPMQVSVLVLPSIFKKQKGGLV